MAKYVMLRSAGMTYWINPDRVARIEGPDTMQNDCTVVFGPGDKVHLAMPMAAVAGALSRKTE